MASSVRPLGASASGSHPGVLPSMWVAAVDRELHSGGSVDVTDAEPGSPLVARTEAECTLLFDGILYNRAPLILELGLVGRSVSDADVVARAYERWALDFIHHLKGLFAIVVVDARTRRAVAVRDPLGAFPLFTTESSRSVLFSTSIDALRRQPGVDGSLNRAAIADHLCRRWPDHHETFFTAIRRVPPGHLLQRKAGTTTVTRYWNPVPAGGPVPWVNAEDLQEQFELRFEQAVERALGQGKTGIFLSGGLDSISVAATAADVARRDGNPLPLALSLGFPGDTNEEREQRGAASVLGLDQEYLLFDDVVPQSQLLTKALAIARSRPAPLLNTWMPAYNELARVAKARGVHAILSGAGGDDWLAVTPCVAADLIRNGDLAGLSELIAAWGRSYNLSLPRVLKILVWSFGLRPLASATLSRWAPRAWEENRVRRSIGSTLGWVAPEGPLRRELDARIRRYLPTANPAMGFYLEDIKKTLEHPLSCMELEEIFEMGRAMGVRFLHPYWDAEVADILYRTPPLLLFAGGRSKSLVRKTMARRFPALGLDRQKKRAGTAYFSCVLDREVAPLWRSHPDLSAMADLGIVDPHAAAEMARTSIDKHHGMGLVRIWDLISTEAWIRAHQ